MHLLQFLGPVVSCSGQSHTNESFTRSDLQLWSNFYFLFSDNQTCVYTCLNAIWFYRSLVLQLCREDFPWWRSSWTLLQGKIISLFLVFGLQFGLNFDHTGLKTNEWAQLITSLLSQCPRSVVFHPSRETVPWLYHYRALLPPNWLLDLQRSPSSRPVLVARQCRLHSPNGCDWRVLVYAHWAEGNSSQQWTQIQPVNFGENTESLYD